MKKIGVYIHIPFCNEICPYCDFYSVVKGEQDKIDYLDAVINSIKTQPFGSLQADTLYLGGGTPTTIGGQDLVQIAKTAIDQFNIDQTAEISLEANPESTTLELLKTIKEAGFNRISFGLQSAIAEELTALGRIHTVKTAKQAILNAKSVGFTHISADLMMGIPYQTAKSLSESIELLTQLPLDHISAYMLGIEEGTPFYANDMQRLCMDEEELSDSYLKAVKQLEQAGFIQYEISNFAKKGGQSKHNLKYWKTEEYLGIGPSAHSFLDGERFALPSSLDDFINTKGDWNNRIVDGNGGDFAEYGMLMLRLKSGLNIKDYKKRYPTIDEAKIMKTAKILADEGYATIIDETISFTPEGLLLSNYLIAQLLF